MATLVATLKQYIRTKYKGRIDRNELRPSEYGALNLFRKQSASAMSILTPEIKDAIVNSFGNEVQIPVLDFENITIGNLRTCEIQTGGADSKLMTVVLFTMAFGFPMVPSRHRNNDLGMQEYFARNLEARRLKALEFLDGKCVDFLNLNKNAYFPAGMTAYYPVSGNALQVSLEDSKEFFNYVPSILATQDFGGRPDVLTNPMGMAYVRKLEAQGTMNAENLAYQVENLGDFFQSNRVLNGAGVKSTEYLVGDGAVAIQTRLDPDTYDGHQIGNGDTPSNLWTTQDLPGLGTVGLYYQAKCSDESVRLAAERLDGLTRTFVESFEWSWDVALLKSYNSDGSTRYTPITKAELLLA
ncbi:hypothetical protein HHL22_20605 [Hymenobacter sp. RP-2-7]|uniref:Phage major capsid protein n=1 Tax=Hymenobacter polaris TaxID=2682546 RepID=A0A7Y0AHR6_9BACT|nr:hypothetical protein [Hymenobacter polaris]NML67609.1 hypothetical protein [Hymenobacter polaris]